MIFALFENCIRLSRDGGTKSQVLEILRIIESYLVYHFGSEEAVMGKAGDDRFDVHRRQHISLLGMLKEEIAEIENNHPSLTAQQIAYRLHDWYVIHLKQEDAKLAH